jgi:ferritin-like metal-binding protein YciE
MTLQSLEDLFLEEVKDIYDAEKRLVKALPKMAKAASTDELRQAFESHLQETEGHVERLEQILTKLDKPARGKKCKAMEGLVEEGADLIDEKADPAVRDAGLICAAQKVEHYEIAAYGALATWATVLGHDEMSGLLEETLKEEKGADEKLTKIAAALNPQASHSA